VVLDGEMPRYLMDGWRTRPAWSARLLRLGDPQPAGDGEGLVLVWECFDLHETLCARICGIYEYTHIFRSPD
jgi:hypothetical protein